MKLRFILNPHSGRRRRNERLRPILAEFAALRGNEATVSITEGPGHATALAREAIAEGCERVIAVGGDGTMNEVAQALLRTSAALALVPCGSGNGLARHLGLPGDPRRALAFAADPASPVRVIDTGVADGRPFFNAMGVGLDAEVSLRFNRMTRRGLPAYAGAVMAAFAACRRDPCTIVDGDRRMTMPVVLVSAANSDQYGNGAVIAPGARVDDGALDLVAVMPVGPFGAVVLAARLFLGSFDRSRRVIRLRGPRFVIEREAAGPMHTDGEPLDAAASVEVAVAPASLRVVAPLPEGAAAGPRAAAVLVKNAP